jgi:hypothetical protein
VPYVIQTSVADSRAVYKEFDPDITSDYFRKLAGVLPLTAEDRATVPTMLRAKPNRRMPHVTGWLTGPWIVSRQLRDLMEELEPGVQEFSPLEVLSQHINRSMGTYFLMLPPPRVDAVIAERSELERPGKLRMYGTCVLDADAIRGRHFWRGANPFGHYYFCSDELHDGIVAAKLDGWDFRHHPCRAERR